MHRTALLLLALPVMFAACSYASGQDRPLERPRTGFEPDAEADRTALDELPPKPRPAPEPAPTVTVSEPVDAGADDAGAAHAKDAKDAGAVAAKPKPAPAAGATCDGKATPCPMQKFMRGTMVGAGSDPAKLAAAFARAASIGPPGWTWGAIAQKGAAAAKAGDVPGAKAACSECHGLYKEKYKAQFRARAF